MFDPDLGSRVNDLHHIIIFHIAISIDDNHGVIISFHEMFQFKFKDVQIQFQVIFFIIQIYFTCGRDADIDVTTFQRLLIIGNLRQGDFDAGAVNQRGCDHKNDQQYQNHIGKRSDINFRDQSGIALSSSQDSLFLVLSTVVSVGSFFHAH